MVRQERRADVRVLDDCFAHDRDRMRVKEALALLAERTRPVVGVEAVPLAEAHGRVLAETVLSARDVPGSDNAAVDGYAFAHADLAPDGETRLRIEGRAAAGHPWAEPLRPGCAVRVLTGAVMPAGADTALMQEDVRPEGDDHVVIPPGVRRGANRRRAGEDVRAGAAVLRPGLRLRPQEVGVAASVGRRELRVFRRLRVALLSSGDELREPGDQLPPGATYDSNRIMLRALLRGLGAEVSDLGILPDRADAVRAALTRAADGHDAVLTSGGASRGDEDHVVAAVRALGRLHFWQIAMKPGRPLALGQLGGRAVFVGLPGNPVAAMVCFLRFARPVLLRLGGAPWIEPVRYRVPADFDFGKKPDRLELLRAALVRDEAGGGLRVRRIAREGSGILTSLAEADGLVEVAEEVTAVRRGDPVDFIPFSELGVPG
ncbi:MAG TPA: gephyrin-like molybdotransferase Glp [Geminicoccaceae bacterium]|nr:gephyrin-like molybdotransferase Glp [Geminicoccaceae bacterium]